MVQSWLNLLHKFEHPKSTPYYFSFPLILSATHIHTHARMYSTHAHIYRYACMIYCMFMCMCVRASTPHTHKCIYKCNAVLYIYACMHDGKTHVWCLTAPTNQIYCCDSIMVPVSYTQIQHTRYSDHQREVGVTSAVTTAMPDTSMKILRT